MSVGRLTLMLALLAAGPATAQQGGAMVSIPAGEFLMGSPAGEGREDERPRHKVRLEAYSIDAYEVTLEEFVAFLNSLPPEEKPERLFRSQSFWIRKTEEGFKPAPEARPEEAALEALWAGAEKYCRAAGKRLPTEAEWERACRAGSDAAYSFGGSADRLGDYAWYKANNKGPGHPKVGVKRPNAWGIYDMHGGVWEMVSDWYAPDFYARSPAENPESSFSTGGHAARVLRGGSRLDVPGDLRCAARRPLRDVGLVNAGFRCAK